MPSKSDHELVPVHELMSDKEAKEVLESLKVSIENLPKILESDPQAKKLEAKPGQIIRIHRKEGKRDMFYYRVVIGE
jgi:DNA-directed RNA polymerase subunit H